MSQYWGKRQSFCPYVCIYLTKNAVLSIIPPHLFWRSSVICTVGSPYCINLVYDKKDLEPYCIILKREDEVSIEENLQSFLGFLFYRTRLQYGAKRTRNTCTNCIEKVITHTTIDPQGPQRLYCSQLLLI